MKIFKRIVLSVGKRLFKENNNFKINWFRTLYFNFRVFPYQIAIKLPVHFYGKINFIALDGEVIIEGPILKGMIKFGQNRDVVSGERGGALIMLLNTSKIIFKGPAMFYSNCVLRITQGAELIIGKDVVVGSNVKICCSKLVIIGDKTGIGFESQIIDTNFHYMRNDITGMVQSKEGIIKLGSNNWIGNRSSILKGTKTPHNTTVSSGSMLNKNYCDLTNEDGIVMAGIPAKIIKNNFYKVTSPQIEYRIQKHFFENELLNEVSLEDFIEK